MWGDIRQSPCSLGPLGRLSATKHGWSCVQLYQRGVGEGGRMVFVAGCMHTCSHTLGHLGQSTLPAGLRQRPCKGLPFTHLAMPFTGLAAALCRSDGPSARGLLAERTPSWQLPWSIPRRCMYEDCVYVSSVPGPSAPLKPCSDAVDGFGCCWVNRWCSRPGQRPTYCE